MTDTKNIRFDHAGVHLHVKNVKKTKNYYKTVPGFYDGWTECEIDGGLRRDTLGGLFG